MNNLIIRFAGEKISTDLVINDTNLKITANITKEDSTPIVINTVKYTPKVVIADNMSRQRQTITLPATFASYDSIQFQLSANEYALISQSTHSTWFVEFYLVDTDGNQMILPADTYLELNFRK